MQVAKLLGEDAAKGCRDVLTNELSRRAGLISSTATASRPALCAAGAVSESDSSGSQQAPQKKLKTTGLMDALDELMDFEEDQHTVEKDMDELTTYSNLSIREIRLAGMKTLPGGREVFDTLKFWSHVQHKLPIMASIARSALSVMATEANTERAFSSSGAKQ